MAVQLNSWSDEAPLDTILQNSDETAVDPIFQAVQQNNIDNLTRLLKKRKRRPLPLAANYGKWTALHLAASKPECKECLELLLLCISYSTPRLYHVDDQTNLGETALHFACKHGCEENVFILLQRGCDPEKKILLTGDAALHIAASNGYLKIVRYLLNYQATIDVKNDRGCTPLHMAARAGHYDTCGILLANGADILSLDHGGNLPLHFACQKGTIDTVCLLLEYSSSEFLNNRNSDGITPFMLAISNFDAHGIQYLLNIGARTDICDKLDRMALNFATSLSGMDIFSLLLRSTCKTYAEQYCVSNLLKGLNYEVTSFMYELDTFTCLTIRMGPDYLNALLDSHLPKSVLQMPFLQYDILFRKSRFVFSPLAYLFYHFMDKKTEAFDQCLDLLLKHKITMIDEFQRILGTNWPTSMIEFVHPFSILITKSTWSINNEHYFNLLIENNISTDYCLQCYCDNNEAFDTFYKYKRYYGPVIYAIERYNIKMVKLFISNSAILEPDILCYYLIIAYTKRNRSAKADKKARNLYKYLTYLKPVYHKWNPQNRTYYDSERPPRLFLPAAGKIDDNELLGFNGTMSYNFQIPPLCTSSEVFVLSRSNIRTNSAPTSLNVTTTEEFSSVTLQQLCRTAIREQLREPTLGDNLRNFGRKISELPLPNSLKDYLLFKK
ncbi:hypothetical protein V9T40_011214 [Parthenolecanium corni]|uniref:SOCS box domain-containing protein n=1 Tax=Parthenolecanium corni TaxID=536013 RepID=A0AAN9T8X8_9HEMI